MKFISTRFLLFQLVAGVLALSFVSCGSDDDEDPKDTSAPEISIPQPSEDDQISRDADDLIVAGELTDDVALDRYTMTIEYTDTETSAVVMNNNSKKSTSGEEGGTLKSTGDEEWSPDKEEKDLEGDETYSFSENYKPFGSIPENCMLGEYTLYVEVWDEAGNSNEKEIVFEITGN
ncbi:MAG: DUF4625 domain-containing protein [Marinilabilia sp.]